MKLYWNWKMKMRKISFAHKTHIFFQLGFLQIDEIKVQRFQDDFQSFTGAVV